MNLHCEILLSEILNRGWSLVVKRTCNCTLFIRHLYIVSQKMRKLWHAVVSTSTD